MTKEYIYTEKAPSAIGAYSQAVKFNGIVYLSGQIPKNARNNGVFWIDYSCICWIPTYKYYYNDRY